MPRKRWTPQKDISPSLLKFREKRKWQINLRRYVIHKSPCPEYAPFFGLDIKNMRQWFEYQFTSGLSWENFGKEWQFDHLIPVTYFDFTKTEELKICWNFTNLRVEKFQLNKDRGNRVDVLAARNYFDELFQKTGYLICQKLLQKIETIEISELLSTEAQQNFIRDHREFLSLIEGYSTFEFELLNSGRDIAEVRKEIDFLKNLGKRPE
jgi:hypothetical protein